MRLATTLVAVVAAMPAIADAGAPLSAAEAKRLVEAQVTAMGAGQDAAAKTAATFAGAIVLAPTGNGVAEKPDTIADAFDDTVRPLGMDLHVKLGRVTVGGTGDVAWIVAEAPWSFMYPEFTAPEKGTLRLTELAVPDGGRWKVIAAHVSRAYGDGWEVPSAIEGDTDPGPLAALVSSPKKLDAALASDPAVAVFGTDASERAIGPSAAHALLRRWKGLEFPVVGKVREIHTASYGLVIANVDLPPKKKGDKPDHMRVMVFAVPDHDSWRVVSAHYSFVARN